MELRGTITDDQSRTLTRAAQQQNAFWWWVWCALVIALLSFPGLVDTVEPRWLRWLPFGCGAAVSWLAFIAPILRGRSKLMRFERVLLSDACVEAESAAGMVRLRWEQIVRVHRERDFVLLITADNTYVPLVRWWSANDAEWQQLLAMIPRREA